MRELLFKCFLNVGKNVLLQKLGRDPLKLSINNLMFNHRTTPLIVLVLFIFTCYRNSFCIVSDVHGVGSLLT